MSYWTIMSSVTAKEATSCKNLRTSSHRQDRDCVSTCLCPFSELWLDVLTIAEGTQTPCTVIFRVKDRVWLLSLDCCRVCLTYSLSCDVLSRFKLDGDSRGWLEIDAATGEIRTKDKLDREALESFEVTLTAFEKGEIPVFLLHNVVLEPGNRWCLTVGISLTWPLLGH